MERYDPDSGVVYRETIINAAPSIPWDRRVKGSAPVYEPHGRVDGVESLYDKCMRHILQNLDAVTSETFQNVPTPVLFKIWQEVIKANLQSVHLWKQIVANRQADISFSLATKFQPFELNKPLVDCFADITSPSGTWLTCLKLSNLHVSALQLKQLHILPSLRSLEIKSLCGALAIPIDDSIIEFWRARVEKDNAFRSLYLLSITNAPNVTTQIFSIVDGFPVLHEIILRRPSIGFNKKSKSYTPPPFRSKYDISPDPWEPLGWVQHDIVFGREFLDLHIQQQLVDYKSVFWWQGLIEPVPILSVEFMGTSDSTSQRPFSSGLGHGYRRSKSKPAPASGTSDRDRDGVTLWFHRNLILSPFPPTSKEQDSSKKRKGWSASPAKGCGSGKKRQIKPGKSLELDGLLRSMEGEYGHG